MSLMLSGPPHAILSLDPSGPVLVRVVPGIHRCYDLTGNRNIHESRSCVSLCRLFSRALLRSRFLEGSSFRKSRILLSCSVTAREIVHNRAQTLSSILPPALT